MNMNYKEKFEEFLSKMQRLIDNAKKQGHVIVRVEDLENAFPELKESEDERIRKALIHLISEQDGFLTAINGVSVKDIIAWLEKQDSHYTFEIKKGHWYKCVCDYMPNDSDLIFKNNRLYYCRRDWRLGGEIDELNVKDIGVNGYKSFFRPATNQEIKDWLEKQGEQKPAVEGPKFKAGNWIVFNGLILHIDEIVNGYYRTTSIGGIHNSYDWDIDNVARRWSIQDAKDGDVLYSLDSNRPFIYKERNGYEQATAYCGLNIYGTFFVWSTKDCVITLSNCVPATKEQRALLSQKMKEAGYTFDFEKKELKKIIDEKQKSAWSEEDEKMLNNVIYTVKYKHCIIDVPYEKMVAWLKSLKPKNRWKPNDEQINALDSTLQYSQVLSNSFEYLNSLFNELKKLREEE